MLDDETIELMKQHTPGPWDLYRGTGWVINLPEEQGLKVNLVSDAVLIQHAPELLTEYLENRQLFALQRTRTMEAYRLWQQAHNQPHVYPDLGELIGWLLERIAELEADIEQKG